MGKLTTNQLMVLLDLYRGTDTQSQVGTYKDDLTRLFNFGLIITPEPFALVSAKGEEYIKIILTRITISPL